MKIQLTPEQKKLINKVDPYMIGSHIQSAENAIWIMQEYGYFDSENNNRFTVEYSPSSTEIDYITRICKKLGFNRNGR